jgi:hypothetical protein
MLSTYVFTVSSCVWVRNSVEILRGPLHPWQSLHKLHLPEHKTRFLCNLGILNTNTLASMCLYHHNILKVIFSGQVKLLFHSSHLHFKVRFQSALIHKTSAAMSHAGSRQDRYSKVERSIATSTYVHTSSAFIHARANKQNTMV